MEFFNIFSSKKEKKEDKSKIIVDFRERNSLVPSELIKLNFEIEFKQLSLGDYLVKGKVIERKTFSDLQSSIINKRIFSQLNDLDPEHSILIIEGSSEKFIHENAIRGFLLSLAVSYKIPFLFSEDEKETATYISLLAKKEDKRDISLRHTRSGLTTEQRKQFILEGFPGIGPKSAKKLLDRFKSLENIFNAPEEELREMLGKKAESFTNLLKDNL